MPDSPILPTQQGTIESTVSEPTTNTHDDVGIMHLPKELLFTLTLLLQTTDIKNFSLVNKAMHEIISSNYFWREKFKRYFPQLYNRFDFPNNENMAVLFKETYLKECKSFTVQQLELLNAVANQDISYLSSHRKTSIINELIRPIFIDRERTDNTINYFNFILTVANEHRDQQFLDLLHELGTQQIIPFYQSFPRKIEHIYAIKLNLNAKLLHLAIVCNRPLTELSVIAKNLPRIIPPNYNHHPSVEAARFGKLSALKFLIELNPDFLEGDGLYYVTPLIAAAANGHTEVVAYLLKQGAAINAITVYYDKIDDHKLTPLAWAVRNGHMSVVNLLLQAGADLLLANKAERKCYDVLEVALKYERFALYEFLLQQMQSVSRSPAHYWNRAIAQGLQAACKYFIQKLTAAYPTSKIDMTKSNKTLEDVLTTDVAHNVICHLHEADIRSLRCVSRFFKDHPTLTNALDAKNNILRYSP